MCSIDTERVVTEVRLRPPLWDLSSKLYKDRDAKIKAWTEICEVLVPNFNDSTENEKKQIGK